MEDGLHVWIQLLGTWRWLGCPHHPGSLVGMVQFHLSVKGFTGSTNWFLMQCHAALDLDLPAKKWHYTINSSFRECSNICIRGLIGLCPSGRLVQCWANPGLLHSLSAELGMTRLKNRVFLEQHVDFLSLGSQTWVSFSPYC